LAFAFASSRSAIRFLVSGLDWLNLSASSWSVAVSLSSSRSRFSALLISSVITLFLGEISFRGAGFLKGETFGFGGSMIFRASSYETLDAFSEFFF
jgi:hypothetical protein